MDYSTLDDMKTSLPEAAIIQLTDDENLEPTVIDPDDEDCTAIIARIDEAIAAADAEIDTYCAMRYSTPFATVPLPIKKLSVDIAVYNLYKRKVETIPEAKKDSYSNAIRMLKDISAGKASLAVGGVEAAAVESQESTITAADRIFTRGKMKGF